MALPDADKLAMLRDPAGRAEMDRLAQSTEGPTRAIGNWAAYVLLETFTDEYRRFQGRTRATSPASSGARRGTPWPTSRSPTGSRRSSPTRTGARTRPAGPGGSRSGGMVAPWSAPRTRAHLDMIDSFSFSTTLLARAAGARAARSRRPSTTSRRARPACTASPTAAGWPSAPTRRRGVRSRHHRPGSGAHAVRPAGRGGPDLRRRRGHQPRPRQRRTRGARGRTARRSPGTLLRSGRDTTTVTVAEAGGRRVAGRSAPAG